MVVWLACAEVILSRRHAHSIGKGVSIEPTPQGRQERGREFPQQDVKQDSIIWQEDEKRFCEMQDAELERWKRDQTQKAED